MLAPGLLRTRAGVVSAFDVAVGIGEVEEEDGARTSFHCSAIWGGSRVIEVGTPVRFSVAATHGGRLQAVDLTPPSAR